MAVIIETSIGHLTVDLFTEERPRCSKNFLKLCKVKYYNFSLFHSVQQNLVAQTGDPTATGRGGMSVYGMVYGEQARYFDIEVTPRIKHKKRGLLSMVNNGNGRHGSQFFITLGQDLDYLDGEHTVFGEVAEGFEVLDKLNEAYCDEKHRPYRDIRIFHTVILDDPFDDPEGLVIPDKSPGPTQEMLESDRIGVDEEVDDTKGMTQQEVEELHAEREANANAQLLEMVGDIPDADVKPPDNVLFVCKLNPVTTDEDLEMIFSRFGPIVSCEVIKDHKTKESLQYAFVEFEKPEHCENAYFKMDNVLIDDRRIHVDFSQSVSKLRPSAAGKKIEEEKEDQPRYVLKDQQRRDNNYDLVYEHDLAPASTETKKSKKHKHHRHSDSEQDGDNKDKKKKLIILSERLASRPQLKLFEGLAIIRRTKDCQTTEWAAGAEVLTEQTQTETGTGSPQPATTDSHRRGRDSLLRHQKTGGRKRRSLPQRNTVGGTKGKRDPHRQRKTQGKSRKRKIKRRKDHHLLKKNGGKRRRRKVDLRPQRKREEKRRRRKIDLLPRSKIERKREEGKRDRHLQRKTEGKRKDGKKGHHLQKMTEGKRKEGKKGHHLQKMTEGKRKEGKKGHHLQKMTEGKRKEGKKGHHLQTKIEERKGRTDLHSLRRIGGRKRKRGGHLLQRKTEEKRERRKKGEEKIIPAVLTETNMPETDDDCKNLLVLLL